MSDGRILRGRGKYYRGNWQGQYGCKLSGPYVPKINRVFSVHTDYDLWPDAGFSVSVPGLPS